MIAHATVIGRTHRLLQQNCQDFAMSGRGAAEGCFFGLVADGCGSKYVEQGGGNGRQVTASQNEVGAKLLGNFAACWLAERLEPTAELPLLVEQLSLASVDFLKGFIALYPTADEAGRARLVATQLLATLVGFVVTPTAAAFFSAGDGYLGHNGQLVCLDEGNRPRYLAYNVLGEAAVSLKVHLLPERQAVDWLVVATDGWTAECLAEVATPRPTLELQRWLNVQAKERGRFEDDGGVAVWHPQRI
jgi:hypothetical protein